MTGGSGVDFITASNEAENFRFTSAADSTGPNMDQVTGFAGSVNYVGTNAFSGNATTPHTEARLEGSMLQIDVDGDGQMTGTDIQVNLTGLNGELTNSNFLIL